MYNETERKDIEIPSGPYCHGIDRHEICKHWKFLGTRIVHRDLDIAAEIARRLETDGEKIYDTVICKNDDCALKCWETPQSHCQYPVVRCEKIGITDDMMDTLLFDQCKECGVDETEEILI